MGDEWAISATRKAYSDRRNIGPAIPDYMKSCDVRIPPGARRRWRRQARALELNDDWEPSPREEQKWQSLSRARTPTQGELSPTDIQSSENPQAAPEVSQRVLATMERVWDLERNTDAGDNPDWDIADLGIGESNPSKIGRAAERASLLLDLFCYVKPVDDNQLTVVQNGLIAKALTSVLEITQFIRVLAVTEDTPLEPLPVTDDPMLTVYSGCVVCYARVADTLLMPCRHLTLCEVCCDEIHERVRTGPMSVTMKCPLCRTEVTERVKIFRG